MSNTSTTNTAQEEPPMWLKIILLVAGAGLLLGILFLIHELLGVSAGFMVLFTLSLAIFTWVLWEQRAPDAVPYTTEKWVLMAVGAVLIGLSAVVFYRYFGTSWTIALFAGVILLHLAILGSGAGTDHVGDCAKRAAEHIVIIRNEKSGKAPLPGHTMTHHLNEVLWFIIMAQFPNVSARYKGRVWNYTLPEIIRKTEATLQVVLRSHIADIIAEDDEGERSSQVEGLAHLLRAGVFDAFGGTIHMEMLCGLFDCEELEEAKKEVVRLNLDGFMTPLGFNAEEYGIQGKTETVWYWGKRPFLPSTFATAPASTAPAPTPVAQPPTRSNLPTPPPSPGIPPAPAPPPTNAVPRVVLPPAAPVRPLLPPRPGTPVPPA